MTIPAGIDELAGALRPLGWVTDLFVGGSAATGDHRPGVSDLDLVAVTARELSSDDRSIIVPVHQHIDATAPPGTDLGCTYVAAAALLDRRTRHPTWTHGQLVQRTLSDLARADLVRHGYAVFGRLPQDVLPMVSDDDVRRAAQAELLDYWAMASRHPSWWLDPSFADLGLTSMARGRHAWATGQLLTKSAAIDVVEAPAWLREGLRARRDGHLVRSPRLRTAWHAWRDARRTTAAAGRWHLP